MAITSNNIYSLQLLRNGEAYATKELAFAALQNATALENVVKKDGVAVLARYIHTEGEGASQVKQIRTLVGYYAEASAMTQTDGASSYMTIVDTEGTAADVEELKARLGDGVTTANTVTDQLTALSGNSATAQSGDTSVEGAKKYADEKIAQAVDALDYTDTAATGSYVSAVNETNGVISVTRVALPSVADTAVAKKFVTEVDQTNGEISVSRGEITSTGKTITLTDGNDGGIDFAVNIDNATIVKDASTGVLSVASTALTQYIGDEDTINISAADAQNNKTISSLLSIKEVSTDLPDTVAHRYMLAGTGTTKIGEYIDIPKDSALVNFYLGHVDDLLQGTAAQSEESTSSTVAPGTGDTALVWIMQLANGKYKLTAVDVHSFIDEAEFASGVTWDNTNKKVKGVVDSTSEKDSNNDSFLTVGADGFKVDGIKDEIDAKIAALDATVGDTTVASGKHVAVQVVEANGVITTVTVTEDKIADADDLAALSAKTVTEIASSNSSITVATAATTAADGTVKYDVITDASKIQMSGFTGADVLSGITQASSITEAFLEVDKVITENEETVSAALNDLEESKVENIVVNGVTGTFNNKIASVTIDGNDVVLGADYVKPAQGSAIATGDTVDEALGKLEAKVDAAVAGGVTSIVAGDGIAVDATQTTTPTVSVKLTATSDLPSGIAENAIKFDATSAPGMYIEYIDCGTY